MTSGPGGQAPGRVEVRRRWDAAALETAAVTPRGAAAAAVTWQDPSWVESGPSAALAGLMGRVLVSFGELAFRWNGPPPAGLRELPGRRPRRAGRRDPWRIVATRTPEAAALLFEDGWSGGDQVGLVAASEERCAEILLSADLSGAALVGGEVLFAAAVDGAGALVAAATEGRLRDVLGRLATTLGEAGVAVDL